MPFFQYPILRIVGCKTSASAHAASEAAKLSVSYPADRWLQVRQRRMAGLRQPDFQYPILRIVGCKTEQLSPSSPASGPFQYPILRIVGCKQGHRARCRYATRNFQYPILRIVGCKTPVPVYPVVTNSKAFSILSCGSLVASVAARGHKKARRFFQYPILRIVGCKANSRGTAKRFKTTFSILSCGSLVASMERLDCRLDMIHTFSILSCGSLVASATHSDTLVQLGINPSAV